MRSLASAVVVLAMLAFGVGVYHAADYLKAGRPHAQRPSRTSGPSLPGTIYVVQAGALYRFQHGKFTQITKDNGWMQPAADQTGNRLVAVSRGSNSSELYLLDRNGGVMAQVTHNATSAVELNHWVFYPRFSADGSQLFYDYDPKDPYNVYRVDLSIFASPADPNSKKAVQWTHPNLYSGGDVSPLPLRGGGFIYSMAGDVWDIGFVVGLDYGNPQLEPHALFQEFKLHPSIASLLRDGQMIRYGAKAIPEGGWWSRPRPYADGVLLVGDSAGMLNPLKLKGIHLAMKSGMLAAETVFEAIVAQDASAARLAEYDRRLENSWVRAELYAARNFHQGFERGLFAGLLNAGLGMVSGGRGFGVKDRLQGKAGYERMEKLVDYFGRNVPGFERPKYDGRHTFSKLDDVFRSGTTHDENTQCHVLVADTDVCATRCAEEFGNPCQYFCPANVYEMIPAAIGAAKIEKNGYADSGKRLQINFANCVHCKTCDIMDPYQIIDWVPPEGGGGPVYTGL